MNIAANLWLPPLIFNFFFLGATPFFTAWLFWYRYHFFKPQLLALVLPLYLFFFSSLLQEEEKEILWYFQTMRFYNFATVYCYHVAKL